MRVNRLGNHFIKVLWRWREKLTWVYPGRDPGTTDQLYYHVYAQTNARLDFSGLDENVGLGYR